VVFTPADGGTARWRRADEFIEKRKLPGDLVSFRDIMDLLDVDKATAAAVIAQVRVQREKTGKPTLTSMRGAGWLLARPEDELDEDTRRQEHLLSAAEGRVRLLGSIQSRRAQLNDEQRRALDFKQAQAALQAQVLGSRRAPASEILHAGGGPPAVPITARRQPADDEG
jgi:hypothetical protein